MAPASERIAVVGAQRRIAPLERLLGRVRSPPISYRRGCRRRPVDRGCSGSRRGRRLERPRARRRPSSACTQRSVRQTQSRSNVDPRVCKSAPRVAWDPANSSSSRLAARSRTSATFTCRPSWLGSGLLERLDQEVGHRLGLLPRLLRLLKRRLGLVVGPLELIVGSRLDEGDGPQPEHACATRATTAAATVVPMPPRPPPRPNRDWLVATPSLARRPAIASHPRPRRAPWHTGPPARAASDFRQMASRARESLASRRRGGTIAASRTAFSRSTPRKLDSSKAGFPVKIEYSTSPRLKTSLAGPAGSPLACSGLMYCGVPKTSPVAVTSQSGRAR